MEITFIQKALGVYTKDTQAGRALDHLPRNPDFQTALNGTHKLLAQARKATEIQFLCFARVGDNEGARIAKQRSRARLQRQMTIHDEAERLT
jgi:hypothetical protein